MELTVHNLLVLARKKVADGWLQGDATDGKHVCAQYAIHSSAYDPHIATGVPTVVSEAERFVLAIVNEPTDPFVHYPSIPTWNDMAGRTQAEVLAVFDEAIKRTAPTVEVAEDFRPDPWPQARFTSITSVKALVPWWHAGKAAAQICAATPTEEKTKELVGV